MNNVKDQNANIEETESDVRDDVQQMTDKSKDYLESPNGEETNKVLKDPLEGRGSDPCPPGQHRNPETGECE